MVKKENPREIGKYFELNKKLNISQFVEYNKTALKIKCIPLNGYIRKNYKIKYLLNI